MSKARLLLLLPHGLCLIAVAGLLIITPTLNYDDLQIAEWATAALQQGWAQALATVLFNLDLGISQPRTYGLARAIQYIEAGLFGSAPAPAYALIVLAHFGSGALIYRIVKEIGGDTLTASFATVAWLASPAVLPMLKVQHYFLYLIAPYYPLLGWVLLSSARQPSARVFLLGTCFLTVAWLLGEGVTAAIFAVIAAVVLLRGSWRRKLPLVGQGVVAGLLLFFYLGFQYVFIRDPDVPHRFRLAPDAGFLETFLRQLGQNGRAVIGLSHRDAELGMTLGGLGVFNSSIFWGVATALIGFGIAATRSVPRSPLLQDRRLALIVAVVCISSLGVYLLFMAAGLGVLATRYSAAFFALMPVALIAVLLAYAPSTVAQVSAAVIAALSLALSLTLLYRAEVLVSEPNRVRLSQLQGRVVVLRPDSEFDLDPAMFGATPGLVPIGRNGLADPMRSLWTSELALRQYASAPLGNRCRLVSGDKADLFLLGHPRGIYPLQDFVVEGSDLSPEEACSRGDDDHYSDLP